MSDPAPSPPAATCAICGKPRQPKFRAFCSKRCADVDLNRWLKGVYAVPVTENDDEDGDKAEDAPAGP
ncbi:MAG: DNA gyrase inhibitor YacG [Alphaproteobacteria bacterium]|nr:DNA gyrase inhibitor YacG [Alphaproteobacteria bacterium]